MDTRTTASRRGCNDKTRDRGETFMAQAVQQVGEGQQLALSNRWMRAQAAARARAAAGPQLCAGCRAREARYGFREEDADRAERPRTLCFVCLRVARGRRQACAATRA